MPVQITKMILRLMCLSFLLLSGHKIFIALVTGISIFLSGFYALTTEKTFTAKAVFEIEQSSSKGLSLGGDLGAIAAIAGFGSSIVSSSDLLIERIRSREFILAASQDFSLSKDKYFNSYNPNAKDPAWKALIKKLIGWQTFDRKKELLIQNQL